MEISPQTNKKKVGYPAIVKVAAVTTAAAAATALVSCQTQQQQQQNENCAGAPPIQVTGGVIK